MPKSKKIKIFNDEKFDKKKKNIFKAAQKVNERVAGLDGNNPTGQPLNSSGVFGSSTYEPVVKYNFSPEDKVIWRTRRNRRKRNRHSSGATLICS
jgi:hypothetical protein